MATAAPALALTAPTPSNGALSVSPASIATIIAVIAVGARIVVGLRTPLWFDETFSAVIASQPTAAAMVDWCRAEIGGPVYYMALWFWAQLFGSSPVALRSLSFVASVAAPLLILWRGHPDRATRTTWAALVALWLPGLDAATNARPYALAMLAATAQAITYWRLIETPTRTRALAWTSASVVAILTHNHCGPIALAGGLMFVAIHRGSALRCWPALAPLAPLAGWLTLQLPVLAKFGSTGAWYPPFGLLDLALAPGQFFESLVLGLVLTVAPTVAFANGWRAHHTPADRALAASGPFAFAAVLLLAMIKPSFTWRYAIPYGPTILFGLTIWVRGLRTRFAIAPALLLALFAVSAGGRVAQIVTHPGDDYRTWFNLSLPSSWLGQHGAKHLAFLWDSPTGTMSDPRRIGEVAGYFLRQHRPTAVTVLRAPGPARPADVVRAALRRDPSIDAIIWLADRSVPRTQGVPDRRMMARLGWTCRNFARDPIQMLTCRRPTF